jgi:Na+/phosphate symporter
MNIPALDYVGLGFTWLFVLLLLGGYFYLRSKTGKKWVFLVLWASGWGVMGISYIFLVSGVAAGECSITLIRSLGYLLYTATILTAIAELKKVGKK